MASKDDIIRTADICDDHEFDVQVCEIPFDDYAKRNHFHGQVVTFSTFEDNKTVRDVLAQGAPARCWSSMAGGRAGARFAAAISRPKPVNTAGKGWYITAASVINMNSLISISASRPSARRPCARAWMALPRSA